MTHKLLQPALASAICLAAVATGTLIAPQAASESSPPAVELLLPKLYKPPEPVRIAPSTTTVPASASVNRLNNVAPSGLPAWIEVPSIGISESLKPDGLNSQGVLEPPPGQVIWYNHSSLPGQPGNALIAGHDEWDGPSNFWDLDEVTAGQSIIVRYSNGRSLRFVITYGKSELKTEVQNDASVWQPQNGFAQLIVITCDKYSPVVSHHHLSNFIVYAKLVG